MMKNTGVSKRTKELVKLNIEHEYVKDIHRKLDLLRERRKNVSDPSEIRHAFIVGNSGVGKTTLVRKYVEKNSREAGIEHDTVPVIRVEVPNPLLSAGSLYDSILDAAGAILIKRHTIEEKKTRTIHHLKGLGTEMLILDEFQHIISSKKNNHAMMDVIKHLANVSNVVIVCVGLPGINSLRHDAQYKRRFKLYDLPKFNYNRDFLNLLWNIEDQLNLKNESRIYDENTNIPQLLYDASGGVLGFLMPIIEEAVRVATAPDEDGNCSEIIDKDILKKAFEETPDGLESLVANY